MAPLHLENRGINDRCMHLHFTLLTLCPTAADWRRRYRLSHQRPSVPRRSSTTWTDSTVKPRREGSPPPPADQYSRCLRSAAAEPMDPPKRNHRRRCLPPNRSRSDRNPKRRRWIRREYSSRTRWVRCSPYNRPRRNIHGWRSPRRRRRRASSPTRWRTRDPVYPRRPYPTDEALRERQRIKRGERKLLAATRVLGERELRVVVLG